MTDDMLEADCPECDGKVRFTLDDLAYERTVTCTTGDSIKLQDGNGGARQVKQKVDDLAKQLSRTINIRI